MEHMLTWLWILGSNPNNGNQCENLKGEIVDFVKTNQSNRVERMTVSRQRTKWRSQPSSTIEDWQGERGTQKEEKRNEEDPDWGYATATATAAAAAPVVSMLSHPGPAKPRCSLHIAMAVESFKFFVKCQRQPILRSLHWGRFLSKCLRGFN